MKKLVCIEPCRYSKQYALGDPADPATDLALRTYIEKHGEVPAQFLEAEEYALKMFADGHGIIRRNGNQIPVDHQALGTGYARVTSPRGAGIRKEDRDEDLEFTNDTLRRGL
jgi:hypothetical protein